MRNWITSFDRSISYPTVVVFWVKEWERKLIKTSTWEYDFTEEGFVQRKLVVSEVLEPGWHGYRCSPIRDFISTLTINDVRNFKPLKMEIIPYEYIFTIKRVKIGSDVYYPTSSLIVNPINCANVSDIEYSTECNILHISVDKSHLLEDITSIIFSADIHNNNYYESSKLAVLKNKYLKHISNKYFGVRCREPGKEKSHKTDLWYIESIDDTIDISFYGPTKNNKHVKMRHTMGSSSFIGKQKGWKKFTQNRKQYMHNLDNDYEYV